MSRIPDELLATLDEHPAWLALAAEIRARMDAEFAQITRAFITRNSRPDYEDLAARRAVYAFCKRLLDLPRLNAAELLKALENDRRDVE